MGPAESMTGQANPSVWHQRRRGIQVSRVWGERVARAGPVSLRAGRGGETVAGEPGAVEAGEAGTGADTIGTEEGLTGAAGVFDPVQSGARSPFRCPAVEQAARPRASNIDHMSAGFDMLTLCGRASHTQGRIE